MRRFTTNERLNAAVAGGLSALSLLVDAKDRRIFFALVFFARSFVNLSHHKSYFIGHIAEHATEERAVQEVRLRGGALLGPHGHFHQVLHVLRARMPQRLI